MAFDLSRTSIITSFVALCAALAPLSSDAQESPPPKPESSVVIELVQPATPTIPAPIANEGSGEEVVAEEPATSPTAEPPPVIEAAGPIVGSPWRREATLDEDVRVQLDANELERVYRGARITRIGRALTAAGAGVFLVTTIASVGTSLECGFENDGCEEYGAAVAGMALGASAMWTGTVTWSAGTLVGANAMRRGGVPVSNGAGIAAVVASATWFPIAWIAAPIQHHENRREWEQHVQNTPDVSFGVIPAVAGGQFGATLSLRF